MKIASGRPALNNPLVHRGICSVTGIELSDFTGFGLLASQLNATLQNVVTAFPFAGVAANACCTRDSRRQTISSFMVHEYSHGCNSSDDSTDSGSNY